MKKHTAVDGYNGLSMIQDMVPKNNKEATVEILDESVDDDSSTVLILLSDYSSFIFKLNIYESY